MGAMRPALIVLAAGRGSRFDDVLHKLLQPLDGSCVLGVTLSHAIASDLPLVVVTTEALAATARRSVAARDVVVLPEVGSVEGQAVAGGLGMGHSIAVGVQARSNAPGWLVLPGDMPLLQPASIRAVADALAQHPLAYAQYRGRRGHPVAFAGELYSELIALTGDEGARRLLARYPAFGVEVDDPGALVDIDTRDDLDAVRVRDLARRG